MFEIDVRRVRCGRESDEGTSKLALLLSTGDVAGNFRAAVVGELRNIDCGRGRVVALPVDTEGGGPASRPFVDCLRCLDELRVEVDKSGLVESLDIDGEMSGDGEAERGFDDWPVGGNNRGLLELLISSGSCDIGFDTVGVPFPPLEGFVRPSFPPHRSTNSCTELCRLFDLLFRRRLVSPVCLASTSIGMRVAASRGGPKPVASSGPSSLLVVDVVSRRLCVGNQLSAGGGAETRGSDESSRGFGCTGGQPPPVSTLACFMAMIQDDVALGAGVGDGGGDARLSEIATASCGLGM